MYAELIEVVVPGLLRFLYGDEDAADTIAEEARVDALRGPVSVAKNERFRGFLNLFESLLFGDETRDSLRQKEEVAYEKEQSARQMEALRRSETAGASDEPKDRAVSVKSGRKKVFETPYYDALTQQDLNAVVQKFFMACIWGFGAQLEAKGREEFNKHMQESIINFMKHFSDEDSTLSFRKKLDYSCIPTSD